MPIFEKWIRNLWAVSTLMIASQSGLAATVQGSVLVGDQSKAQQVVVPLAAGNYRVHLLDPFASGNLALASAGAILTLGTDRYAQLSLDADGTSSAEFSLAQASELDLFVHAAIDQGAGAAVVAVESLTGVNAAQYVFEQAFSFNQNVEDSDRYAAHGSVNVAADSSVRIELADMHELSFSFAPLESIVVRVANTTATEVLDSWCWYQGDVSVADAAACVNMDGLSAPDGQTLNQTLSVRKGFVSWYVAAKAPIAQTSQLGWRVLNLTGNIDLGEDVVVINRSGDNYAREIGRFTLVDKTVVDVSLNSLTESVSPFGLAIISTASGNAIRLDNLEPQKEDVTLNAGEYRVLLSDEISGDEGLLGIRIDADSVLLFDEVFSLGDFQRLGELESTAEETTPASLSIYELRNPLDVIIANSSAVAVRLSDVEPAGDFMRAPGRYSVWGRFDAAAADDLYRVRIGSESNRLGEFTATTGARLIAQREVALSEVVTGSMEVRNFAFPDALMERFRMIMIQGDGAPLKFDVDNTNGEIVEAAVDLRAGVAYIALFASQSEPDYATVLGYRFEYESEPVVEPETPPRSSNGSGGGKSSGGGSLSSFLLYLLLVFRYLRQRTSA